MWVSEWNRVDRAVAACAGGRESSPLEGIDADRLVASAVRERTAALMAERLPLEPLKEISTTVLARNIRAMGEARGVVEALGPHVIPLKGLHLLGSHYAPGERDFGDLDFLVPREAVGKADAALAMLEYRPAVPFGRVLGGGEGYLSSVLYESRGRFPVHLHWNVINASVPLFMVRVRPEEIWAASVAGEMGGAPMRRMAPHHLLVTLCEHAMKHSYAALIHLVDVDRVWRAGVDADRTWEAARRWGLMGAVRLGLFFAARILGTPVEVTRLRGTWEGWISRCMRFNRRWGGIGSMGYFSMARGWREKGRFLRGLLRPRDGVLVSFGKPRGARSVARRAWRAVAGTVTRWR